MSPLDVVTGSFSFTGRYIAEELLERGRRVRTLTRREPDASHPLAGKVETAPLVFDDSLRQSLAGADTLYNTYWVRFERGETTFDRAVENTSTLFAAARQAGVRRIVHISVANSDEHSPYPYFRGKAQTEAALRATGLSHAVVRPTMLFGPGDILVNDVAWVLRHAPVFLVPGNGSYEVQPVFVGDVAHLCVEAGAREDDVAHDAAGPERFALLDFVRLIKEHAHGRAWIRTAPVVVTHTLGVVAGLVLRDVVATRDELEVTVAGLLASQEPPLGRVRFSEWLAENGERLGRSYASELRRNFLDER